MNYQDQFNHVFYTPMWKIKFRSMLSQFGDLFSEFGKYIAPAYYHDRCERSVGMRLYTMHKHQFVLVFAAFFSCLGLCVFIGLAGPPITSTVVKNATAMTPALNSSTMATGPFVLKCPPMSTYSQQLWIIAQVIIQNSDADETFRKTFHVGVSIHGISDPNEHSVVLGENHSPNRSRELHCLGKVCDSLTVLHLGFLDFTRYVVSVRFFGLESSNERHHIKEVVFNFKSYNPSFTQLEIWFRFVFLVFTFLITCWFAHSLRRFVFRDWSIEQKWMSSLLPLLLLYNGLV